MENATQQGTITTTETGKYEICDSYLVILFIYIVYAYGKKNPPISRHMKGRPLPFSSS